MAASELPFSYKTLISGIGTVKRQQLRLQPLHKYLITLCVIYSGSLIMQRTRTVYNFKNTCQSCFNDIELPLLGEYSDGEIILQTKDGQDFYIAELIGNTAFDFIVKTLLSDIELNSTKAAPQKVLTLLADKVNGREFTTNFPICPICKKRLTYITDDLRTNRKELRFATWTDFESLTGSEKINRIKEVVQQVT